ncbi:MAG: hypothetical protein WKF58_01545 [Ilumatobacteraceae bacterium]
MSLRGDTIVSLERAEGADQSVLVVRSLDGGHTPRVLVDVTSGAGATAAIDWFEVSPDASLVAFGTSIGGTERSVLRVVATADGSVHADEIPDTRACSVAWEPDSGGFFYTRYPSGDEYGRIVRHHRLGDPPDADPEVWTELPMRAAWPDVVLSPDGRWLIVHVGVGWSRTDVHVLDRTSGTWSTVIEGVESESHFVVGHDGQSLLGMTTLGASSGRIVKVPLPPAASRRRSGRRSSPSATPSCRCRGSSATRCGWSPLPAASTSSNAVTSPASCSAPWATTDS